MSESATDDPSEQFREYTEAVWNHGNVDAVDELFAVDVVVHDVPIGETYDGRDEFVQWVHRVRESFPDFEVDMETIEFVVSDDRVVSQWTVSGTHEGPLSGFDVDPTGNTVEFSGVTVYRLDGTQVTEAWWYYDTLTYLGQLGLVPEELPA